MSRTPNGCWRCAAGFDAGFALAASLASTAQLEADPTAAETASRFGVVPAILDAIKQWETARMARAFSPEIRAQLRDNTREFHLQSAGPGRWDLFPFHIERYALDADKPATELSFDNPYATQPLQWFVRSASDKQVGGLRWEINGKSVVDLRDRILPAGGCLKFTAGEDAALCDPNGKQSARIPVDHAATHVSPGAHKVSVRCDPAASGQVRIEIRTVGPATRIEVSQQP